MRLSGREKRFLVVIALSISLFSCIEACITSYRISLARGLEDLELENVRVLDVTKHPLASRKEGNQTGDSADLSLQNTHETQKQDTDAQKLQLSKEASRDVLAQAQPTIPQKTDTVLQQAENISVEKMLIDINTATYEELVELPGIGPVLAERILEYRLEKGRFLSVDELLEVRGIGEKLLLKIKPYLTI